MQATLYIVSAPSGAGKTSLVKVLVERDDNIVISVSHTTRTPRAGEVDGEHYYFTNVDDFKKMVAAGQFLEHARVFDNFYGTSRQQVETTLAAGTDVILEIDWQGARLVRAALPAAVSIFILPPSRDALDERLRTRGQDSDEIIARRMSDAISEISHYDEFEYLIINDDFDTALGELAAVFLAPRLRLAHQQSAFKGLIADLLA